MPEVAGELGERTIMNTTVHPPEVKHLHHVFNGWLGDDLLECFPCFIVTVSLAESITSATLTGVALDDVETSVSSEFEEMYPGRLLPKFRWLKVVGGSPDDDFMLDPECRLEVSDRCLGVLRRLRMDHATVIPR